MTGYAHPPPSSRIVADGLAGHAGGPVDLATSYELCRRLQAAHGRTYYFATRFLPAERRHHVHALYGFARYADDLVDHLDLSWTPAQRRAAFERWSTQFLTALDTGSPTSPQVATAVGQQVTGDPVLPAVLHTVRVLGIDREDLGAFLRSMAMDLTVTRYRTYDDLGEYVHGSAAVIGAMMLPVLGPTHPDARARAMDLGIAFQLTNFLRDISEDWDRGRIYLPLEDLERFEVGESDFQARHVTAGFRRLLAFEVARTRALYRRAEQGWTMLEPASRTGIRIAHRCYAEILDRLEVADYQVFHVRAAVPTHRKLAIAASELTRRRARQAASPPT
ncbi:MAG: phytoene/squalene synthase family protein [Actinomycetota bacterium]|nr:phytoene/squalene synthase family protein [Actinomycetota bacterium]